MTRSEENYWQGEITDNFLLAQEARGRKQLDRERLAIALAITVIVTLAKIIYCETRPPK